MSATVQWALVVLGFVGAAGTWFRAWVAYREHRSADKVRHWSGVSM
jgi:hypothetical protein